MKILLLNPSFITSKSDGVNTVVPLGLGYLGTALIEHGIEVFGLDAAVEAPIAEIRKGVLRYGLKPESLKAHVEKIMPDIVGIGCFFSSRFPAVLEAARVIKSISNRIIIVTGGIHPSIQPENVCSHKEIDFVIIGEGERSFINLIETIAGNGNLMDIDGLAFKKNGRVMISPKTEYIENIDKLGYPAWELFDMERYLADTRGRWGLGKGCCAPVITSRSCPFRCTFCSVHSVMGSGYRSRSAGHVVGEIERLVRDYGVNEISFEDDNLTYDKNRFVEICKGIIDRNLKIKWNTPNGVHIGTLDTTALKWAKASGCDSLNLAIESGDEYMRNKVIRKGLRKDKIYEITRACHKIGIRPNAYFVIGMPGETENSIAGTEKYIRELNFNNISVFTATPMPGTKLFEDCVARGYIDSDAYNKEFVNYGASLFTQPLIETPGFNRKTVLLWRHRIFTAYFRTTLKANFSTWLKVNPRTCFSMSIKVILNTLFGNNLGYRLTGLIRKIVKK